MAITERTIEVGDVELTLIEAGQGGSPLLLVHGFTGAKEDFADHLEALADDGWHAVAPDLRGHGSSTKPTAEAAYSLEVFAADMAGLVDALGWERLVVLGHSMGGMVVQHLALRHGDRLDGLVLMDTGHGPVDVDREGVELGKAIVREGGMAALVDAQRKAGPGPLDSPASIRLRETKPGYQEFGERKGLASADAMWLSMIDELMDQDDRLAQLGGLAMPTLVIVGEQDTPFLGPSERMAETIPNARLAVLPDAGHSPQFENPDAWFAALAGFLADVRAGAVA